MKSFSTELYLVIDTINQLVTERACLLCFAENHQYLEEYLASYPQVEAGYQQGLVDCYSHYKLSTIMTDFITFNP